MIATMTPVLLHGRVVWDQALFPRDECEERLHLVQAEMGRLGLDCLIVAGAKIEMDNLVYLTQFVPYAAWALAIVPQQGEMTLVTGIGGGRELPVSRPRTWVADVRNLRSLDALRDLLAERGVTGRIGLASIRTLGPPLARRVHAALDNFDVADADDLMLHIRGSLRSRELSAVRQAAQIVRRAADALAQAHAQGAPNLEALIAAERTARQLGALDYRGLVNQDDDGELAPFETPHAYRSDPLIAYLAVSSLGYWADTAVTAGQVSASLRERAGSILDAMARAARPGARARAIAAAAALPDQELGLGNGIGLRLHQSPTIGIDSDDTIAPDTVLSLRVRLREPAGLGIFESRLVSVTRERTEWL